MGKIHVLDDALIDKIAAGEVVERPASVVKELVENAMDAGADEIRVELEDGGKKLILVTDNGSGIAAEDALLALTRHATSKITSMDDLFSVMTMGFRGEALASIAAVSQFTLFSREAGAASAIKVERHDDQYVSMACNKPQGTTIRVAELFFNVPVRKGFLKKGASEFAAASDYLTALAISMPEISFSLYHNGKEQFAVKGHAATGHDGGIYKGEDAMRLRVAALLGEKNAAGLVYLRDTTKYGTMEALVSPPGIEKANANHMILFVNGRWVKDKALRYGVLRGYQSHLLKGRFPVVVMYLNIDPSLVDVNVHPSKTEIRLQYASEVQSAIAQAIRGALRSGAWALSAPAAPAAAVSLPAFAGAASSPFSAQESTVGRRGGGDFDLSFSPSASLHNRETPAPGGHANAFVARPPEPGPSLSLGQPRNMDVIRSRRSYAIEGAPSASTAVAPPSQDREAVLPCFARDEALVPHGSAMRWHDAVFIGSYARGYLLFEYEEKLLLVDQHAFHERILYERLRQDHSQLTRRQPLLVPEAVEIGAQGKEQLMAKAELLSSLGFDLRDVAESPIVEILAVPMLLVDKDLDALMQELSEAPLGASGPDTVTIDPLHDVLARIACHAAVRAGEELDAISLQQILRLAGEVDFYHNCPHGRRVMRFFSKNEVAGWFDR